MWEGSREGVPSRNGLHDTTIDCPSQLPSVLSLNGLLIPKPARPEVPRTKGASKTLPNSQVSRGDGNVGGEGSSDDNSTVPFVTGTEPNGSHR